MVNRPMDKDEAIFNIGKFMQDNGVVVADIKRERVVITDYDEIYSVKVGKLTFIINRATGKTSLI